MDAPPPSRGAKPPPSRATGLYARTVFRELRQAGYGAADIVSFVNGLLEQLSEDARLRPMSAVADLETALPNTEVFLDALSFELRRAERGREVALLVVDVCVPDWSSDDVTASLHARLARQLKRAMRPTDTVGRLGPNRYAVVLPGASRESAPSIAHRLLSPIISSRRKDDAPPTGTEVTAWAAVASEGEDAASLLARCVDQPSLVLPPFEVRLSRSQPPTRSQPPPSVGADRSVVLALGGGAARAAAHVGVLRALRRTSRGIAGVAGTSAGAIVGAMALLGLGEDVILERFLAFTRSDIYREMRRSYVTFRRKAMAPRAAVAYFRSSGIAFLSDTALAAFDDDLFGAFIEFFVGPDRDIATLGRPFAVAATDLVTGRSVHIAHGPLHQALRASCALPGLFLPQREGDRIFIDGSTIAEVPVRAAAGLGVAAPILAVHLVRPEREVSSFATSAEIVLRSSAVLHKELVREQLRYAGDLLSVPVEELGWLDFRKAEAMAAIGEKAAMQRFDDGGRAP